MRKTIAIGESILDTVFCNDKPISSFVGGRIANAAASIGMAGVPIEMVSECCNDHIGDIIVSFLQQHHVGTASVDRFTDGSSAASMIFHSQDGKKLINFFNYPDDRFNIVWPRIDEDDVIIFGSFYSIDTDMRERFYELIKYAHERKAILVYLLGCQHGINCRITKVMPGILENLEIADIVIATHSDIGDIFPGETVDHAFKNHIEFYCGNFLYIDENSCITVYHRNGEKNIFDTGKETTAVANGNKLGWQAGLTSGITYALFLHNIKHGQINEIDDDTMSGIIDIAVKFANNAASAPAINCIDDDFGSARAEELKIAIEKTSSNLKE